MGGSQNVNNRKTLSQKKMGGKEGLSTLCFDFEICAPSVSHTHRSEKKKTIVHVH